MKKTLAILCIVFSLLFFGSQLFLQFFVQEVFLNMKLQSSSLSFEPDFTYEFIVNLTQLSFIGIFIILLVLLIVYHKKNKLKVFSSSFILYLTGFIFHILGLIGISWIFILISGIVLLGTKENNN